MTTLTMEKARAELTRLPERLSGGAAEQVVTVTRRGQPVLAVLSWEAYESIMETLEIVTDEEQMAALRAGMADVAAGRTRAWEAIKAEPGR